MHDPQSPEHHPEDRKKFERGDKIYDEGEAANNMYVILQGEVEIGVADVKETLGRGAMFGEMGLLEGSPRVGYAKALTEVHLLPVDEGQFVQIVHDQPLFALRFTRGILEKMRRANSVFRHSH
jgi:CRP-like cAMP-binding protein